MELSEDLVLKQEPNQYFEDHDILKENASIKSIIIQKNVK